MAIKEFFSIAVVSACFTHAVFAQQVAGHVEPLPRTATTEHANNFLATLNPKTDFDSLLPGNDLLLDMPAIAENGLVKLRIASTIDKTDGMWLLSLSPQPDGSQATVVSVGLTTNAAADIILKINLQKTQSLLLVVHSDGKYYGLHREIKIGNIKKIESK